MRSLARLARLSLSVACLAANPAFAEEDPMPFQMVRSLQIIQDQVAQGNAAAQNAQATLLAHIAERFLAADLAVWQEPRNARAAVIYVLSGGHPDVIRQLLDLREVPGVDPDLLRGALAYVEGRDVEARALLDDIDVRSIHSSMAGQVALVKATLLIEEDTEAAVRLLDLARLFLPGTLVEESALRREIAAVGELRDAKKFESLAIQYMRRFQGSAYFASFLQQFSDFFVRLDLASDPKRFPELEIMLAELPPDQRLSLYLSIARAALVSGKTATARFAAERARPLASVGSLEAQLSTLYEAAALVVGEDIDAGLEKLRSVEDAPFAEADAELRAAALSVAEQVRHWPDPESGPPVAADGEGTEDLAVSPAMGRAEKAISDIDDLLGRISS